MFTIPSTISDFFDIFTREMYEPLTNFFLSMPGEVKNVVRVVLGALLGVFVIKTLRRFIK